MFESYINVIVVFDIIHKKGTEVSFKLQFSCGLKMATKNHIEDYIITHEFITKLRSFFISRCLPVSKHFVSKRLNNTNFIIRWKTNLKLQDPFKLWIISYQIFNSIYYYLQPEMFLYECIFIDSQSHSVLEKIIDGYPKKDVPSHVLVSKRCMIALLLKINCLSTTNCKKNI